MRVQYFLEGFLPLSWNSCMGNQTTERSGRKEKLSLEEWIGIFNQAEPPSRVKRVEPPAIQPTITVSEGGTKPKDMTKQTAYAFASGVTTGFIPLENQNSSKKIRYCIKCQTRVAANNRLKMCELCFMSHRRAERSLEMEIAFREAHKERMSKYVQKHD